ncbi:MAG: ATP-dependent Clp protease proteolytic subunit, partial [Actinomycetota bacterium]
SDLALEAAELAHIRAVAEELLGHHSGRTAEEVRADTDRALVLWGNDAVTYGLADQLLDRERSGGQEQGPTALRP